MSLLNPQFNLHPLFFIFYLRFEKIFFNKIKILQTHPKNFSVIKSDLNPQKKQNREDENFLICFYGFGNFYQFSSWQVEFQIEDFLQKFSLTKVLELKKKCTCSFWRHFYWITKWVMLNATVRFSSKCTHKTYALQQSQNEWRQIERGEKCLCEWWSRKYSHNPMWECSSVRLKNRNRALFSCQMVRSEWTMRGSRWDSEGRISCTEKSLIHNFIELPDECTIFSNFVLFDIPLDTSNRGRNFLTAQWLMPVATSVWII